MIVLLKRFHLNGLRIRFHRRTQKLELCYNWTKNLILFYLLFLQKAVKMLIDNIDKVPVSLVMMFFDVLWCSFVLYAICEGPPNIKLFCGNWQVEDVVRQLNKRSELLHVVSEIWLNLLLLLLFVVFVKKNWTNPPTKSIVRRRLDWIVS